MSAIEDQFEEAGAAIIWVMEQDNDSGPGTAEACMAVMSALGDPQTGWCVGDAETLPYPVFDDSPFSEARGFDMAVRRSDMVIAYTTNHGNPVRNENPSAQDVLDAVIAVASGR